MRRPVRIVLWVAAAAVAVAVLAAVAARGYLETGSARRLAADQIAGLVGGPVVVSDIAPGAGSTGVDLVLPADPGSPDVPPLLTGRVAVDVSVLGLAAGVSPGKVTVDDAVLTLRLDADGKPLHPLPGPTGAGADGPSPAIEVRNATVHVEQAGKPAFHLTNISATVAPGPDGFAITGRMADPSWGDWTAAGDWAAAGDRGAVTLTISDTARVTQEKLRSIPYIPESVWREVALDGVTTGSVRLTYGDAGVGWYVDLTPRQTVVTVPSVDLTLTDASGRVEVDMRTVRLTDVVGKAAGGTVAVKKSVMAFGKDVPTLGFDLAAAGLDVTKLPKSWGLTWVQGGQLKGSADVTVALKDGKVEPTGSGKGVVENAKVFGGVGEIEVRLAGDGNRLRFEGGSPAAAAPIPLPGRGPPWADPRQHRGGLTAPARLLAGVLGTLLQPAAPPKKAAEPTYVTANLRLRDVNLAELVDKAGVKPPIPIAGKVTLAVTADIPVSDPDVTRLYRVRGDVTLPTLQLADLTLKDVAAQITFRDGVLSLASLNVTVPPPAAGRPAGRVGGSAKIGVDPPADLTADLTLADVPLGEVFKAAPSLAGKVAGPVSGKLGLTVPYEKLSDVTAAVADGELASPGLTVYGRSVGKTALKLALRGGVARIADATTSVEGLPVAGDAGLTLTGDLPWTANARTQPLDVVSLRRLVPEAELPFEVGGKLAVTAAAKGTASPLTYRVDGKAATEDLAIGTAKLGRLTFDWAVDPQAFTASDLTAKGYGGTLTGSVRVPLAGNEPGEFRVELAGVDAAAVTRDLPSTPVKLAGKISGAVTGGLPTGGAGEAPPIRVDLTAPRLVVQGVPTSRLKGTADYRPGAIRYDLEGEAFGGTFGVDGTYPPSGGGDKPNLPPPAPVDPAAPPPPGPPAAGGGKLSLRGLRLDRLGVGQLRGTVTAAVDYRFDPATGRPVGSGRVEVADLRYGSAGRSGRVVAAVRLTPTAIQLPDVTGTVAGGDLRGRLRYPYDRPDGYYALTLDRADAAGLLAPAGVDDLASGPVSVSVRGRLGREVRGTGVVSTGRATVGGVPVGDLRIPFDYTVAGGGGLLTVRDLSGQAAGGRLTGRASYRWGATSRLDGEVRFVDINVRQLAGGAAAVTPGRADGRFGFGADRLRSAADVRGLLVARLGDTRLPETPVTRALAPFLNPVGGLSARFESGDLRARLADGVLRVERFAATGPSAQLFADGTVALSGRLDLDVVLRTRQLGADPGILRLLQIRLPPIGPIPLNLIADVSRFLSNRTVRLRVGGTVSRPAVQVNAAALLAEEAVRFFVQSYSPIPIDPTLGGEPGR